MKTKKQPIKKVLGNPGNYRLWQDQEQRLKNLDAGEGVSCILREALELGLIAQKFFKGMKLEMSAPMLERILNEYTREKSAANKK